MNNYYCPHCKSKKPMMKAGKHYDKDGAIQRWQCTNRGCYRHTTKPLRSK